jgi:hypothetical protein
MLRLVARVVQPFGGVLLSANIVQQAEMNVPLAAGGKAHGKIKVTVALSRKSG